MMSNVNMNRSLGTKWFTFYTKVRPWISCIFLLSTIADFVEYTDVYLEFWWLLLLFLLAIIGQILSICVFVKSQGDYVKFVRFVKGVLIFETILYTYSTSARTYINSEFDLGVTLVTFIVGFIFSFFIWYLPNIKYFKKRIITTPNFETENTTYVNQPSYQNNQIELKPNANKARFCGNCGHKLGDNSKFCANCGAQLTETPKI